MNSNLSNKSFYQKTTKVAGMLFIFAVLLISNSINSFSSDKKLPSVKVKNLKGETVSTDKFNNDGKPMIINFWATWCPPCLAEMPSINKFYEQYKNDEEVVFDINTQVHRVPNHTFDYRPDLTVIQDIKNSKWIFKLDESIKENLKTKKVSLDRPLMFSITRFNDPHQLERCIIISLTDLIYKDFEIAFENQIEHMFGLLSVYTIKRLETYYHEVINE